MPLYMDIHTVDSDTFSVEDVVKAHMEDLAIQKQFGVTQLKYWVNVEAKTLFCLMEGPSKQACNEVHKQSHGNTACNIIEVSDDEFKLFLGKGDHINDLAHTISGGIDTGYRTILSINLIDFTNRNRQHLHEVYKIIEQHEGAVVARPEEEIMAAFIYASAAIQCALSIHTHLNSIHEQVEFTIAISSGRPVDEKGDNLFEETIKKNRYLCGCTSKNAMSLDIETLLLSNKEKTAPEIPQDAFNVIRLEDFHFLFQLFDIFDKDLHKPDFKSEVLYSLLRMSKSQAYRKLKSLTGMAPNHLIRELRLRDSLRMINNGRKTISEIAYELGFNSPTYFSKAFGKRFGISPSSFAKIQ